ncbi:MAG: TIGR00645 family protein [Rickettsiales bacterium]
MEKLIERGLFCSRWLLAPFYLGLIGALATLLVTFAQELFHLIEHVTTMQAQDAILACLSLIDISLAGNLMIIVIFSGYENFVSKIDVGDQEDQLSWKGKVDFTGLKIKLIASIVAISGIHLLKVFMDIGKYDENHIFWMVIIHAVFVASGVMLALMDNMVVKSKVLNYKH